MLHKDYGTFGLVSVSRKKAQKIARIVIAALVSVAAAFLLFLYAQ
ncbi:MAG: hypothetical protein AB1805_06865 [Nitrospirota bacterium]